MGNCCYACNTYKDLAISARKGLALACVKKAQPVASSEA